MVFAEAVTNVSALIPEDVERELKRVEFKDTWYFVAPSVIEEHSVSHRLTRLDTECNDGLSFYSISCHQSIHVLSAISLNTPQTLLPLKYVTDLWHKMRWFGSVETYY